MYIYKYPAKQVQSAWSVKYTNCIFAEGLDTSNDCSGYDAKLSVGEAQVPDLWEM